MVGQIASGFVSRLTRNLGQAVQPVKLHQDRSTSVPAAPLVIASPVQQLPAHQPTSPFQFRLPPPLI